LVELDLSDNPLDDQAVALLIAGLATRPHDPQMRLGLQHTDIQVLPPELLWVRCLGEISLLGNNLLLPPQAKVESTPPTFAALRALLATYWTAEQRTEKLAPPSSPASPRPHLTFSRSLDIGASVDCAADIPDETDCAPHRRLKLSDSL
jgi:hypothetical protein